MMISKIADQHLSRQACIYIRQSTMGQVRFNQESTERKGEERTAFLREAIEREIERREAAGRRKPEKRKHRR
jgi:hypothetical protein